jgi:hypothetical protein
MMRQWYGQGGMNKDWVLGMFFFVDGRSSGEDTHASCMEGLMEDDRWRGQNDLDFLCLMRVDLWHAAREPTAVAKRVITG